MIAANANTYQNFYVTCGGCPVELCWLYSLFEKRISENVIQARVVIVEYYVNNIHSEDK